MQKHHAAWLEAHQERTAQWLEKQLDDGFEIHHIDGNHANDAPDNLVLIERLDHMRLHGIRRLRTAPGHMRAIGKLSAAGRLKKLSPAKRSRIARNAVRIRWRKAREKALASPALMKAVEL